jgi:prolyl 4-hydroxylase
MKDILHFKDRAKKGDKKAQLALSYYYFEHKQHQLMNEVFLPLLKQGYPPALIAKVDFLMQKSPEQGIEFLYQLAEKNIPLANYKMAMLIFFHPEMTLNFASYLEKSCRLGEIPAVIASASLFYQLGRIKQAEQLLFKHNKHALIAKLIQVLGIKEISGDDIVDFELLVRPKDKSLDIEVIAPEINLCVIDDFLCKFDCEWLKIRALEQLEPSVVVDGNSGDKILSEVRTSKYAQLIPNLDDWVLLSLEKRIADVTKLPITAGELSNILQYEVGQEYKAHYDFFHPKDPGSNVAMQDGGQRIKTVLCYIQPSIKGGETYFPRLSKKITGKTGQLVIFDNTDKNLHPNPFSLHQGLPVLEGTKWIFSKWIREKETSYKNNLIKLNL